MATSAFDIITRAMRIDGIIGSLDTPDAQDTNDAFNSLNMILEQWSLEDLMCYYSSIGLHSTVASQSSYTIGEYGTTDWDAVRPIEITGAFLRIDGVDRSMDIINHEEYKNKSQKALEGIPNSLYYQPTSPNGIIYPYPVPDDVYSIGLSQKAQFTVFTGLETSITLPPGYLKALIWNLAVEIAPEYGKAIDPVTMKKANDSKALIKSKNSDKPELNLESAWLGENISTFDINAGF
jgi:hypothetical protein